jgi:hypothetical protein
MEIFRHKDDYLKIYSDGVETGYKGSSILYDGKYKTLLYYYYPNYKKLFVLDEKAGERWLTNVTEKVRIVAVFKNRQVVLFNKYLKSIIKNKAIFYFNDEFFLDLMIVLRSKKILYSKILMVYDKYRIID